jgi:hypothetical protein
MPQTAQVSMCQRGAIDIQLMMIMMMILCLSVYKVCVGTSHEPHEGQGREAMDVRESDCERDLTVLCGITVRQYSI